MDFEQHEPERHRAVRPIVAFYSIIGFWLFYTVIVTARAAVMDFPSQGEMIQRRVFVTAAGIVLTWLLYLLLRRFDRQPLWLRITTAFIGAMPCAIAVALVNYYVFNIYDPSNLFDEHDLKQKQEEMSMMKEIAELAISRFFFFAAWAALYLAISYAGEVRAAERRAAQYARAAQQAELRSLRYQVNPHFLFNTLNSLSSLVMKGQPVEAEAMIMNLSTFYRTSLSGDPLDDVTLEEEVKLQRLYLDIEAVRFPQRLKTRFEIPDKLLKACVPGLILQPLVENAIKYGVSRAKKPVTIAIMARSESGRLIVTVTDNGNPIEDACEHGSGIGLANVRDRLAARFGAQASIEWLAPEGGGFVVRLIMPEVYRGC
ncbi:sensor histidine kinase [Sphingobium boeckii]|uniref:Sensor histidine kinase YesM n=1 Tax=Sphingobium boeckii TaxID=1082345 RepID=A0A7W9EDJ2_9SPHN|nr:histidine kinase [Sphingobium boeckii]MBB5684035.1 sensor histidine kinase YesM [Sphingobium boeckii]